MGEHEIDFVGETGLPMEEEATELGPSAIEVDKRLDFRDVINVGFGAIGG